MSSPDRRSFLMGAAGAAAATLLQPDLTAAPLRAPVRVGLIGCGRQGRAILGELGKFEAVTVAGLADTDERRLRGATRRAPDAPTFETHAAMLEGADVDAVVIATPTHAHLQIVRDALAAGRHVYCEAPLANTLADCKAIASAARRAEKLVFQSGFQGRANPVYGLARSFVRAGAIRKVFQMRAQFHQKTSWRTPSPDPQREKFLNWHLDPAVSLGLIGEEGAQQFDVMHWFTGDYPTSVRASGGNLVWDDGREVEDTVHVTLAFPEGARFDWDATLGNSYEGKYELLLGTMGAVKLAWSHGWMFKEADAATQGWEVYANRQQFHNDQGITLIAEATKLAAQGKLEEGVGLPHAPLYYALESFLKSVTESEPVTCSAEEGLRATAVALRALEAMRSGGEVAIPASDFRVE